VSRDSRVLPIPSQPITPEEPTQVQSQESFLVLFFRKEQLLLF